MFIFSVGFRSQAANVLKNQQFSLFPIEKPKLPNLTLPSNRSGSLQGHHLNKLWWAVVPDATYQVSWKSAWRFWRRRFLKGFYHIWAWQPSWSCDSDAANKLSFPLPKEALHTILALIGQAVLEKKKFEIVNDGRTTDGRWTDDGRTPDHEYPISSPMSRWLRWAKNLVKFFTFNIKPEDHWSCKLSPDILV